jgi:hypothetical protein
MSNKQQTGKKKRRQPEPPAKAQTPTTPEKERVEEEEPEEEMSEQAQVEEQQAQRKSKAEKERKAQSKSKTGEKEKKAALKAEEDNGEIQGQDRVEQQRPLLLTPFLLQKKKRPTLHTFFLRPDKPGATALRNLDMMKITCRSAAPMDFIAFWIEFVRKAALARLTDTDGAAAIANLDPDTKEYLGVRSATSLEELLPAWQLRVDMVKRKKLRRRLQMNTREEGETALAAIKRVFEGWEQAVALGFVKTKKGVAFLWSQEFLRDTWFSLNRDLFQYVAQQKPTTLTELESVIQMALVSGLGGGGFVEKLEGKKNKGPTTLTIVTEVATPLRTEQGRQHQIVGPAAAITGQDIVTEEMRQKFATFRHPCNSCGFNGHPMAYCPSASVDVRLKAYQRWLSKAKKNNGNNNNETPSKYSPFPTVSTTATMTAKEFQDVLTVTGAIAGRDSAVEVGLDTLAAQSVVRQDAIPVGTEIHATKVMLQGVANVPALGRARLKVQVSGITIEDDFLVCATLPVDVVICWGTLLRYGLQISKTGRPEFMGRTLEAYPRSGRGLINTIKASATGCAATAQASASAVVAASISEEYDVAICLPAASIVTACLNPEQRAEAHISEIIGPAPALEEHELGPEAIDMDAFGPLAEAMTDEEKQGVQTQLDKLVEDADALDELHKQKLRAILEEFTDVFSTQLYSAERTGMSVTMNTNGRTPAVQPMRQFRHSDEIRARLFERLQHFYKAGLLEPVDETKAHYPSNLVLQLRNGKLRLAHDVGPTNQIAETDRFPTPAPREILSTAAKAVIFSTVDQTDAYYQISMAKEYRPMFCFYVPEPGFKSEDGRVHRLLQWTCMVQGFKNAPAIMHRLTAEVLADFDRSEVNVLFDDAALFTTVPADGSDPQDVHLELIRRFLARFRLRRLLLKPTKCNFGRKQVKHQGFLISHGKWEKDPETTRAIMDLQYPTARKELQSLLGTFQVYSSFIPGFGQIAAPLHELLKEKVWTAQTVQAKHREAVDGLKTALRQATALHMPDWSRPFYFRVDSGPAFGIAGVIGQVDDEKRFLPLEFHSRKATTAERNYWAAEMELRGITWLVCDKGRRYSASGRNFVLNDGKYIKDLPRHLHETASKRILNDLLKLQGVDVTFVWQPRSKMVDVDTLNRCASADITETQAVALVMRNMDAGTPINIMQEQAADPIAMFVRLVKRGGTNEEQQALLQRMPLRARELIASYRTKDPELHNFVIDNERLYHLGDSVPGNQEGDMRTKRLYVPLTVRERFISEAHDEMFGAHGGVQKTQDKLRHRYYWIGMMKDTEDYVKSCDVCVRTKGQPHQAAGLRPLVKVRPFSRIAIDMMTDLPKTTRGNIHILAVKDVASGRVQLAALPDKKGLTVARFLLHNVLLKGYTPTIVQCDNAPEFIAGPLRALNNMLGVTTRNGSPWKPSINGAVERANHTIAHMLQGMCNSARDDWDQHLPFVEHGINTSVFATTGLTPVFYETGFNALTPFDLDMEADPPREAVEDFDKWAHSLAAAREWAALHREDRKEKMAQNFDNKRADIEYNINDRVWAYFPVGNKLQPKLHGPFPITRFMDEGKRVAVLQVGNGGGNEIVAHIDRLVREHELPADFHPDEQWQQWVRDQQPITFEQAAPEDEMRGEMERLDADEYEVDHIVSHRDMERTRTVRGKRAKDTIREYLVHYKGYGDDENQWKPESELQSARELLRAYQEQFDEEGVIQPGTITRSGRKVVPKRR